MFVICQECGAPLTADEIEQSTHHCSFEQMLAFQTQCARIELERELSAQVAQWEHDPRLSRRLEFARYLRDRRGPETARASKRRPVRALRP